MKSSHEEVEVQRESDRPILKEAEAGVPVTDLLRCHSMSRTTFLTWRNKYADASVTDVKETP